MMPAIAWIVFAVVILLLGAAKTIAIAGNPIGASLHPPQWLTRFVFGKHADRF